MSLFHHGPTGILRSTLPTTAGDLHGLAAAYAAGNITLPVEGWYLAEITHPTLDPHQSAVDGEWTYNDQTGVATMTRTAEALTAEQAIPLIKAEAQRRINIIKGGSEPWRGENALSKAARLVRKESLGTITPEEASELALLNAAGDEVDRLRAKSNELEAQYQVTPFDFTADAAWEA